MDYTSNQVTQVEILQAQGVTLPCSTNGYTGRSRWSVISWRELGVGLVCDRMRADVIWMGMWMGWTGISRKEKNMRFLMERLERWIVRITRFVG